MARRLKLFDDELRAKKVITKLERDSKSSHNYKKKNYSTNKNENNPRGKEAVIKITGNTKNLESFKRHIEYITRDYELPLYDNDGNKYEGKDEIKDYIDMYNFDNAIPDYDESIYKERREVLNFVFSMKEQNTTPKDILEKLKIDPKDVAILLINGIDGKLDSKLKENDRLSLFPPVGGG